jgi:hypothetical protein
MERMQPKRVARRVGLSVRGSVRFVTRNANAENRRLRTKKKPRRSKRRELRNRKMRRESSWSMRKD